MSMQNIWFVTGENDSMYQKHLYFLLNPEQISSGF